MAHNTENRNERTIDIKVDDNLSFSQMFISDKILKGLNKNGFKKPSPIQLRAVPLGKSRLDLIIQAKSGTGKTLVFAIVILESFCSELRSPQSLILAPTREIAVQIADVISSIACDVPSFKASCFIGGLDIAEDRKKSQNCTCIVGTPGRILQLIENKIINTNDIKILVFDEVDQLLQTSYLASINQINRYLRNRKQMLAASATLDKKFRTILRSYMTNPIDVTPKREIPILHGIKQFVYEIPQQENNLKEMKLKIVEIKNIFRLVSFKQCLMFSNSQSRAESYCNLLNNDEWPCHLISGAHEQTQRLKILKNLKEFKFRILITTDLMSRGIDAENINLIINLDVPNSSPIYLHRIGRAGRYGSFGLSITFVQTGLDMLKFQKLLGSIGGEEMSILKFPSSKDKIVDLWKFNCYDEEKLKYGEIFGVDDRKNESNDLLDSPNSQITENLRLLEISKLLVDPDHTRNISNQAEIDNIFDDYRQAQNENSLVEPKIVDLIEFDSNDKNFDSSSSSKSLSNVSSQRSANESTTSDSEDNVELEAGVYYRQSEIKHQIGTAKLIQNTNYSFWQQQYHVQVDAIQNYVDFCRSIKH